jgi:hypothetical protein
VQYVVALVYDPNYTSVTESHVSLLNPLYESEWVYLYPDEPDEGVQEDEDDPNDENNWRNDYPDSDHSFVEVIFVYIEGHRLWHDRPFQSKGLKLSNNVC